MRSFQLLKSVPIVALLLSTASLSAQQRVPPPDTIHTASGILQVRQLAPLSEPWGMAWMPDGRLLITEKAGRLRIWSNGQLSEPLSGLPKVEYGGQGGLLDVEVDPDFVNNRMVYFSYTEAAEQQPSVQQDAVEPRFGNFQNLADVRLKGGAVARGRLEGTSLRDVQVIWRQVPKTIGRGHYGGRLLFGPDGMLYITSGERQRFEPAQDMATNLGKIIRIHKDGTIPTDNPFVGQSGVRPDIWTSGMRNPLGIAVRPIDGKVIIHEMGPWQGDELNNIEKGKNYGWPTVANGMHYNGAPIPHHDTRPDLAAPVHYWHPAISPSGLAFYSGSLFPNWAGSALIGGLSSQALVRVSFKGDTVRFEERVPMLRRIRDVQPAADGSIYLLTDYKEGALLRLAPLGK